MIKCKGKNCNAVNGKDHSNDCESEHNELVMDGAGNRNPWHRYAGYKGQSMPANSSKDQKEAYQQGVDARER